MIVRTVNCNTWHLPTVATNLDKRCLDTSPFSRVLYGISIHTHKHALNKIFPPTHLNKVEVTNMCKIYKRCLTCNTQYCSRGDGVNFNYIFLTWNTKCPKHFDQDCRFVKEYYKNIKIYYKPSVNVVSLRTLCNYSSSFRKPIIRQNLKMKKTSMKPTRVIDNRMLWNIINLSWLHKIGKLRCCLLR